jgi:hypothetical protein
MWNMKHVVLAEPSTLALLGLGFFLLCFVVVAVLGTVAIMTVFLTRKTRKEVSSPSQPTPATQVVPKNCPNCGASMPPDSPEGLCPRCLIALNLATQTDIPGEPGAAEAPPGPPAPVADIAKLFPQLEILECLGRGGMGAVYKVRQPRLDRLVALKILSPEKQGNQKFADRFEREARALAKLHHPNIVTVFDFGEVEGNFYLLMEFVDGLSLRQLLQQRKLAPPEALAIVPKICEALQYAHQQGIVHRDIKPENILMDKDGHVKIADFGIAKILGDNGGSNLTAEQIIGTPHYMSPEQIEKPQAVDHRADIYSLGVVFYEMLTGELPLGKFQPPSKKVQVDVRLDEIVLRALEKEPERRYQQASEVKTRVEAFAATASARSSRQENEGSPTLEKPKVFVLGLAIIVLSWMAGILFLAFESGKSAYIAFQLLPFVLFIFLPGMIIYFVWRAREHGTERALDGRFRFALLGLTALFIITLVVFFVTRPAWQHGKDDLVEIPSDSVPPTVIRQIGNSGYYAGQSWVPYGDSIEIDRVYQTNNEMSVEGRYGLVSHDAAALNFNITTTNSDSPQNPEQSITISRGNGDFHLMDTHVVPGLPHVSMYADGHPFASVYFGTRAEADEENKAAWITNSPSASTKTASSPADDDAVFAEQPPVVVETFPVSGARDVTPGDIEIRVRFSKDMTDGDWSWSTSWENSTPESFGPPHYLDDHRTCVMKVHLDPERTYGWWLNSDKFHNFKDTSGRPAVPFLFSFQTIRQINTNGADQSSLPPKQY